MEDWSDLAAHSGGINIVGVLAMGRPIKPLISRGKVLKVALDLIDREGLEAVSIRRLGRELNIQGISLYHHFKNKEAILVGACELALSAVRTPKLDADDGDWKGWLLANAVQFRKALQDHPNLMPVLMRRHPMRIGLAEHNATAALLAVQGVSAGAIMPLIEALEELALGSASFNSFVDGGQEALGWKDDYPYIYALSQRAMLSRDDIFILIARAAIDAIVAEVEARSRANDQARTA